MLVISREVKEAFYIGDNVKITVIETSNNKIELLVESPQDILVRVVDNLLEDEKASLFLT